MRVKLLSILLAGLLIGAISCKTSKKISTASKESEVDLIGTWTYWHGYFEHILVLKSDSIYEYRYAGDMIDRSCSGTWYVSRNSLVLNSDRQNKVREAVQMSSESNSPDGVKLYIHDSYNIPVVVASIKVFNDSIKMDTVLFSTDGHYCLNGIEYMDSVYVDCVNYYDIGWRITDRRRNYELILPRNRDDYIYQTDEKWKIKDDRLYYPNAKRDNRWMRDRKRVNYFVKVQGHANKSSIDHNVQDITYEKRWGPLSFCFKRITLKRDSSFIYVSGCEHESAYCIGRWKLSENLLSLNCDESFVTKIIDFNESFDSLVTMNKVRIRVTDTANNPLSFQPVFINDDMNSPFLLDEKGTVELNAHLRINQITIGSHNSLSVQLQDSLSNDIEIVLNNIELQRVIINEQFRIDGELIYNESDTLQKK